jgi:hypothetical protein
MGCWREPTRYARQRWPAAGHECLSHLVQGKARTDVGIKRAREAGIRLLPITGGADGRRACSNGPERRFQPPWSAEKTEACFCYRLIASLHMFGM